MHKKAWFKMSLPPWLAQRSPMSLLLRFQMGLIAKPPSKPLPRLRKPSAKPPPIQHLPT
jgi:hypothetical protein